MAPLPNRPPLTWRFVFQEPEPQVQQILPGPNVWLEGTYRNAFTLLYGYHPDIISGLARDLKLGDKPIGEERLYELLANLKVVKPIDKLSLGAMPTQDAIELAYFMATTQIEMERFQPGDKACGGPIDVMVLKTAPAREILWLPGKQVHHPGTRYTGEKR